MVEPPRRGVGLEAGKRHARPRAGGSNLDLPERQRALNASLK
jgi:hypothetical protein